MAREKAQSFRCAGPLWEALLTDLAKYNAGPLNTPMGVSEWLRRAIVERLAHRARSRAKRRRRPTGKEVAT